jgi:hypothetical protein
MATSRYDKTLILNFGKSYGTSQAVSSIRAAIQSGALSYDETVTRGFERLDVMAGQYYGNGKYWWILAAASDIGWGMQVPPGIIIKIPSLSDITKIIG